MSQQIAPEPVAISEAAHMKEILSRVPIWQDIHQQRGYSSEQVIRVIFIFKFCSSDSMPDLNPVDFGMFVLIRKLCLDSKTPTVHLVNKSGFETRERYRLGA